MEAKLSQNGGSLLAYVVSRLRPDVFSHPIWVHFGDKEKQVSAETIEQLLSAAQQLQKEDPKGACQILLVCAVHQNYAGQRDEALKTMQQMLILAEQHSLSDEFLWAAWGACAICFQADDTEGAAGYLDRLQSRLRDGGEWMLANFVETVAHSLSQQGVSSEAGETESPQDQTTLGLMRLTFNWLQEWGFSDRLQAISNSITYSAQRGTTTLSGSFSSDGRWGGYWRAIKQIVRGELKLRWVANGASHVAEPRVKEWIPNSPPSKIKPPESTPSLADQDLVQDQPRIEPVASAHPKKSSDVASLFIYCLGPFQVYQDDQSIDDWPSSKGKAVFKYLLTHRERPVHKDVLMDLFWSDIPADSARNNLNVAIYGLRQALRKTNYSLSHVIFENGCYLLNPELRVWLDYESFLDIVTIAHKLEENGELEAAISEYSKAEALYQGEFLEEDRYEDWVLPLRRNLNEEYLNLLDRLSSYYEQVDFPTCMNFCRKVLAVDPCRENVHRRLMNGYYQHGHFHLAVRQYHICTDILKRELDVAPSKETTALYQQIRTGKKE